MSTAPLSSNAILYAILALNSEIDLQKGYLESGDISADDRENEQEMLNDLEQAFMEFIEHYKRDRHKDASLPTIEELLITSL